MTFIVEPVASNGLQLNASPSLKSVPEGRYDYGDRITIIEETTPVLRQVAALPGSIYYASAPLAISRCSVKTLPIASAAGRPFVAPYQTPAIDLANCPEQRNQVNKDDFKNGTYPFTRRLFVIKTTDSL